MDLVRISIFFSLLFYLDSMKIHIQSYHSNSYLWEHIVENILTYSNLNVTIITDKNPGLKIKGVEIIECGGGTW